MRGFGVRGTFVRREVARATPLAVVVAFVSATLLPILAQAPADATTTHPITPNGPAVVVTVPTAGANNEADLTFAALPGQIFSVATSSGSFNACDVQVSIVDPDNATAVAPVCGGTFGFLDATAVDDSGQYSIRLAPTPTATGSVTVNLYRLKDQAVSVTAGTGVHAALSTAGQNLVGTYAGTAGQKISVTVTGGNNATCSESVNVFAPDGAMLANSTVCSGTGFIDAIPLPVTGSYRVVLDPQGPLTDTSAVVTLRRTAQDTSTVTPAVVRANGTSSAAIAVTVRNTTGTPVSGDTVTLTGTGSVTIAPTSGVTNAGGKVTFSATDTGAETVTFTATDTTAGVVADHPVVSFAAAAPAAPTLSAGVGSAVNISTPGQVFAATFTGSAGQLVSVDLPNPSFAGCYTELLAAPNGTTLNSVHRCGGDTFLPATHLPFTGTYTVELAVDGSGTGTGTVTYYTITNQTVNLKLNKKITVPISLTTPGQVFVGTFNATAGNEISVSTTAAAFTSCWTLELENARGGVVASSRACGPSAALSSVGLPSTGKYTIAIALDDNGTGTATLSSLTGLGVSVPPTPELNVPYTKAVKVSPGTPPYSLALTGGSLPTGLNLTAGKIKGTPTTVGTFTFTIAVTDADFQTASATFTLSVVNELLITTSSLPNGVHGNPYNASLAGSGGKTPYAWSLNGGTVLPAGLVLDAATGAITGTPTTAGTTNFTVRLTDKSAPALSETRDLSVTIS
jgi:hypothetical protein